MGCINGAGCMHFSHSEEKFFGRFVCLLDLHLIILRRKVQNCGQSEYDYCTKRYKVEDFNFYSNYKFSPF